MFTSHDIAEFIINRSCDLGQPVTNLDLQKLLYYSQGFHLALYGQKLFSEEVKSMDHGPVVSEAYQRFRVYGKNPISRQENRDFTVLDANTKDFVQLVISKYERLRGWNVRELTHNESPWLNHQDRWQVIPQDVLAEFFLPKLGSLDSVAAKSKARQYIFDRYGLSLTDEELADIDLYLELEDEKRDLYARLAES